MVTPEQAIVLQKRKFHSLGSDIKGILEQGRLAATDPAQVSLFRGMFPTLDALYEKFSVAWDALIEIHLVNNKEDEFPTQKDNTFLATIKRYYYEARSHYAQLESAASSNTAASGANNTSLSCVHNKSRLPNIPLPTFTGIFSDWTLYRDSFISLVEKDCSLSKIEKYHFLVGSLGGSALALVKSIPFLEANYDQAWELLNSTYNNRRKLAATYLNQIISFKPSCNKSTPESLNAFLLNVSESVNSFHNLNIPEKDQAGFILFELAISRLDPVTREAAELKFVHTEFPQFSALVELVRERYRALSMFTENVVKPDKAPVKLNPFSPNKYQPVGSRPTASGGKSSFFANATKQMTSSSKSPTCFLCRMEHTLTVCPTYTAADPSRRLELLKSWPGCRNCLYLGHKTKDCSSKFNCRKCGKRHHSTLHLQPALTQAKSTKPDDTSSPSGTSSAITTSGTTLTNISSNHCEVLLGTAYAHIDDAQGLPRKIRLIVDSGSQYSFITRDCLNTLGLPVSPSGVNLTGIGQSPLKELEGKVKCTLRPLNNNHSFETEALVVPIISQWLPQKPIPTHVWQKYLAYDLADPTFYQPGPIDFLIGADLFMDIIIDRPITINTNEPKLIYTLFGYIVSGRFHSKSPKTEAHAFFTHEENINTLLNRFWSLEETSVPTKISSPDDVRCEELFQRTHYRLPEGRYVVSLPFRDPSSVNLGPSKERALRRLYTLEAQLSRNSKLREEYHNFMEEYIQLGHMKRVTNPGHYLIPHHAVHNANAPRPKLRVVFDASSKTKNGSLNDFLLPGPNLQKDIGDILLNFRRYKYVVTADIVKMYRQILIQEPDRAFQHILWRANPHDQVDEYALNTVTYGLTSSPYLALRVIEQLVADEGKDFPLASCALHHHIYVDDVVTGANTIDELQRLKSELIQLLEKGCFSLSKWASNCAQIFESSDLMGEHYQMIGSEEGNCSTKILGMRWNWQQDTFSYSAVQPTFTATKRALLSCIARIYDPLGYIAPVVFTAKTILQETWKAGIGWDEEVPSGIKAKWRQLWEDLPNVSQIRIPRFLSTIQGGSYQIVGFCDASEKGYCAAIYLKIPSSSQVYLLKAKTRLAPIKVISIPRLELCAALLLAHLYESMKPFFEQLNIVSRFFFTDSSVVLGWLNTPTYQLKTFVAHRVEKIREQIDSNYWQHVNSQDNPADCGSRGVFPSKLVGHNLWWKGPIWLVLPETEWPVIRKYSHSEPLPELKPASISLLSQDSPELIKWMERFSSFTKLVRTCAYLERFIHNIQTKRELRSVGAINSYEFSHALLTLIKLLQHHFYPEAFRAQTAKLSTLLQSLDVFPDQEGVLRVGGRIHLANISPGQKHPILLPRRSHFTNLVVDYYHRLHLHIGSVALQAIISQRYWIPASRSLIRQRKRKCMVCYKNSKRQSVPFMGNLPAERLSQVRPFHHTGIDFAGPFIGRSSHFRKAPKIKLYLCLFVCLSVKALHLELVTALSTEAFLDALDRFTARRGVPSLIMTDCGTNFVGAKRYLDEVSAWINRRCIQEQVVNLTAPRGITWKFNPPHSPHFGGIWEANIKAVKTLLQKTAGSHCLSQEELSTLFIKIEGVLNSRPLTPVSTDPTDLEPLTPAHFLVGGSLSTLPEYDLTEVPDNRLSKWQLLRQRVQFFWTRWRHEYLTTLQQRRKWRDKQPNLEVGDLVLINDLATPPAKWPIARVLEVHPGEDQIVRVATVKTSQGTYKRPSVNLIPLKPLAQDSS